VAQTNVVVPSEVVGQPERRTGFEDRESRQRRRQAQKGGGYLREKLPVEAILVVDLATLPSEDPADLPTGLLERTRRHHHRATHCRRFATLPRLAVLVIFFIMIWILGNGLCVSGRGSQAGGEEH